MWLVTESRCLCASTVSLVRWRVRRCVACIILSSLHPGFDINVKSLLNQIDDCLYVLLGKSMKQKINLWNKKQFAIATRHVKHAMFRLLRDNDVNRLTAANSGEKRTDKGTFTRFLHEPRGIKRRSIERSDVCEAVATCKFATRNATWHDEWGGGIPSAGQGGAIGHRPSSAGPA